MNETPESTHNPEEEKPVKPVIKNDIEALTPEELKRKTEMYEKFEGLALTSRRSGSNFDFNQLDKDQKDAVIGIMKQNEDNAYSFHSKRIDSDEKVKLAQIQANTVGLFSYRYISVVGIVAVVLITILLVFFKDQYFTQWLTFIAGLGSGWGLSKAGKKPKDVTTNNEKEDSE